MARNFDNKTTADETLEGLDLNGRRILITGSASGLGAETARALASKGAQIIIAARNMEQAKAAADKCGASANVEVLELGDKAQIETFAKNILEKYETIDVLINNAGVMACPQGKTKDGFEMQFGCNHLGHFYMTNLIMPALIASAKAGRNPRIVNLSSLGHRLSPVTFDDIQFENRDYDKWVSYGQSKTANSLFTVALEARLAQHGVHSFAVHPGAILTPLARHMDEADIEAMRKQLSERPGAQTQGGKHGGQKSVEQGAATSTFAATAPELEGKGGIYLEDGGIAEVLADDTEIEAYGVRKFAIDPAAAEKLWQVSEQLLGKNFSY